MLDPVGASAVRSLSTDVANLTSRLAVTYALIEQLTALYDDLDPSTWDHEPITDGDGSQTGYTTTLPGEESDKLRMLLAFIDSMK